MIACTCACAHTGGYQRPCDVPGGCGSAGCDGYGNIGETPRCRFGPWCATRDHKGVPGPADSRGLCWPDETHGRYAIAQLPDDYAALAGILGKDISPAGGGSVTSTPGPRLPLRENVDALMRQIRWTLETWEVAVRERARLSDVPEHGVRDFVVVGRAAEILTEHYPVLLAYGATDILDYETAAAVDADGPGAVVELTRLHHQARSLLGLTRRRESRALPCPLIPCGRHGAAPCRERRCEEHVTGCGLYELGQDIGTDTVDCRSCGWACTLDEYAAYAISLQAPRRAA
jgi:hypothetical protein